MLGLTIILLKQVEQINTIVMKIHILDVHNVVINIDALKIVRDLLE